MEVCHHTVPPQKPRRPAFGRGISRLVSRSRFLSVALASAATFACLAAASAPAQAATNSCAAQGVGWSSAPFSATMTGTLCHNGTSASCKGGPTVSTSIAGWASPFVSVKQPTGGCFWGNATPYGYAETMWANVPFAVTNPLTGSQATGYVYLRIYVNPNGGVHKSATTSEDLTGLIAELVEDLL